MENINLGKIVLCSAIFFTSNLFSNNFIDYSDLTTKLKIEAKEKGNIASTEDVKKALVSSDWAVIDIRTITEWNAAHIKGSIRVGRQTPEKALSNIVLDDNDRFIKDKLIVICNTSSRASIEAEIFRKMGFSKVKIYSMTTWIDGCNPFYNKYSRKKDKHGSKQKFGAFKPAFCYK